MSNKLVKDNYNKGAENYLAGRDKFKNTRYLEIFNELLPEQPTILDIGCGAGIPVDEYFISHGHKIIGIDISEEQIKLAKNAIPEGSFFVQDMSELKNAQYKVDAVVSFYAIFHTDRKRHKIIFSMIHSFLPKGGKILVTMGSSNYEGEEDDFFGMNMFWSQYDSGKNRKIIQDSGFKILLDEIDSNGRERHQIVIAEKI